MVLREALSLTFQSCGTEPTGKPVMDVLGSARRPTKRAGNGPEKQLFSYAWPGTQGRAVARYPTSRVRLPQHPSPCGRICSVSRRIVARRQDVDQGLTSCAYRAFVTGLAHQRVSDSLPPLRVRIHAGNVGPGCQA